MYPQVIADASNNIERTFPASKDAQISPIKPRMSDKTAATRVPVRLPSNNTVPISQFRTKLFRGM